MNSPISAQPHSIFRFPVGMACLAVLMGFSLSSCDAPPEQPTTPAESFERAVVAYQNGDLGVARGYFVQAEAMSREQDRRELLLQAIVYQVQIAYDLGEVLTAVTRADSGAHLARQLGDFRAEAEIRILEGRAFIVAGIAREAERALHDALRIATTFQDQSKIIEAEISLGELWLHTADPSRASDHFTLALTVSQTMKVPRATATALNGLARVFLKQDKVQEAVNSISQAIGLIEASESPELAAQLRLTQGRIFERAGNANAALGTYRDAVNILRRARTGRRLEVLTLFRIGSLYAANQRGGDARKYFGDALEIARREGDRIAQYYMNVHILRTDIRLLTPVQQERISPRIGQAYQQLAGQFADILQKPGEALAQWHAARSLLPRDPGGAAELFAAAAAAERISELCYVDPVLHAPIVEELLPKNSEGALSRAYAGQLLARNAVLSALAVIERERFARFSVELDGASIPLRHPGIAPPVHSLRETRRTLRLQGVELSARLGQTRQDPSMNVERESLLSANNDMLAWAARVIRQYPNAALTVRGDSLDVEDIQRHIPRGITVVEHIGDGSVTHVVAVTRSQIMVRTVEVAETTVRSLSDEYLRLLVDPMVYRGEGGESSVPGMTRFATLATHLYDILLRPVEQMFDRGVLIIPTEIIGALPLQALEREDGRGRLEYVIERMSVDYLSAWSALKFQTRPVGRLRAIVAFGNPSGKNWSVDYELRDIRSFFRNADVFTGSEASWKNMLRTSPDLLQLSSDFIPGLTSYGMFVVSEGEVTEETSTIAFERLVDVEASPVILLTNESGEGFALGPQHALLLRMNGTSDVFLNRWIADRKAAKFFSEFFFTHLSNGLAPGDAYRQALLNLIQSRENAHPRSWGQFFHFGTG